MWQHWLTPRTQRLKTWWDFQMSCLLSGCHCVLQSGWQRRGPHICLFIGRQIITLIMCSSSYHVIREWILLPVSKYLPIISEEDVKLGFLFNSYFSHDVCKLYFGGYSSVQFAWLSIVRKGETVGKIVCGCQHKLIIDGYEKNLLNNFKLPLSHRFIVY